MEQYMQHLKDLAAFSSEPENKRQKVGDILVKD